MDKNKVNIKEVIKEDAPERRDQKYNEYVKENTPKKSWFINLCKAYIIGGLICTFGQLLTVLFPVHHSFPYFPQCPVHRPEPVPETGELRRGRNSCAHHRVCQFRGGSCH